MASKTKRRKSSAEVPAPTAPAPPAGVHALQHVAGPFALFAHHRDIWRAAATDRTRYTMNSVALFPNVPGLVATDGRAMAMLPVQAIQPNGELGPFGTEFRAVHAKDAVLLPLELFKSLPRRLESGQSHIELTVIDDIDGKRYAIRRDCPYGNTTRYLIDDPLRSGQYPEIASVIPEETEPEAKLCFDPRLLSDVAKAIGAGDDAQLLVFDGKKAAMVRPSASTRRQRMRPDEHRGIGIIMPIALPEPAPPEILPA